MPEVAILHKAVIAYSFGAKWLCKVWTRDLSSSELDQRTELDQSVQNDILRLIVAASRLKLD